MPIVYSGTTGAKRLSVPPLQSLFNDLNTLVNYAHANPNTDLQKKWFGEKNFKDGRNAAPTIATGVQQMRTYLQANQNYRFVSKNTNTVAMADQSNNTAEFLLGNWFSFQRYTFGERIVTLAHELSHKCMNPKTKDEKVGSDSAYKNLCLQLAQGGTFAKALTNAENWGYYIANYFKLAGLEAGRKPDWEMVLPAKLDSRESPEGGGTDDPAIRAQPPATW